MKKDQTEKTVKTEKKNAAGMAELPGAGGVEEPVEMPIDGVLDLHAFQPKEVKGLVGDYIEECLNRGIYDLRIIHGKGTGTLRAIVHGVLKKHPAVLSFREADLTAGGWGATEITLRKK
ncbi:MAG: Recombination inhibitory protein MutS2 [Candidatus Saccharicenans subterraneus]|uniref:Recombination inhibitory protein MutS2 n=1 Tax=Candidatus Saccharicenans subterraneus TaxID=2508984 RepID=A0A3E2BPB9_9BACT|nr:MAG: Recombination inhibitory protein MutS2 [Candidatus Saccharicenans subterraneum]